MAKNPKHLNKLAPTAPKPLTDEEKAQQIARFFAQKREQFFQGILFNAIQGDYKNVTLKHIVDESLEAADYALEKFYPMPKEEKKEE